MSNHTSKYVLSPDQQLKVKEIEQLLGKIDSGWPWALLVEVCDRIERLIGELRSDLRGQEMNDALADLVQELISWAVRTDGDFDTTHVRDLAERAALDFP